MIRVVVVAAAPAVRAGLRALVDGAGEIAVVAEVTPRAMPSEGIPGNVEVLLVDLGEEPEALLAALDDAAPGIPAVLLAAEPADFAGEGMRGAPFAPHEADGPGGPLDPRAEAGRGADAMHLGPRAWLLRDATAEELVVAVQAVARGLIVLAPEVARAVFERHPVPARVAPDEPVEALTERELEVLRELALGLPNKAIALRLGISEHTVKFHVGAILAKLGAAGRTEAVMRAARRGLLPL